MEVTFVWSWLSFWAGVGSTIVGTLFALIAAAVVVQKKKSRKW